MSAETLYSILSQLCEVRGVIMTKELIQLFLENIKGVVDLNRAENEARANVGV